MSGFDVLDKIEALGSKSGELLAQILIKNCGMVIEHAVKGSIRKIHQA